MPFLKLDGIQQEKSASTSWNFQIGSWFMPSLEHAKHLMKVTNFTMKWLMRGDRKVMWSIPDKCPVFQKINYTEIKKKWSYIKCWKCPLCSAMNAFTLFLKSDATQQRVFVVMLKIQNTLYTNVQDKNTSTYVEACFVTAKNFILNVYVCVIFFTDV